MKRFFFFFAAVATCATAHANTPADEARPEDSVRMYHLQQIEVTATRASKSTPVAHTDLSEKIIAQNNYGQDVPYLLMLTPSVVATSEGGIGVGSTSFRLRGSDASRINVTANGVPLNNPDSHAMYWYDTPDFLSSVGSVQVQRGAGVSTNGTGAFGGAVNMTTAPLATDFGGDASLSYGSYNTNKQAVHICSGLMDGHWLVDARLTHIGTDGYIDRAATDLKSYMFQAGYYSGNTMVKLLSFGGKAKTYLAYTGGTKEEMEKNGRRYNPEGKYATSDGPDNVYITENGGYSRVAYYDDHTDNYLQINNQLLITHQFNRKWALNFTGHYTYGNGYYKQYKDNAKLLENGFAPQYAYDSEGNKLKKDLIREKLMRNHFGGFNASAHYTAERLELTFGGSWSYYSCPHWGELDWVQDAPAGFTKGMRWYDNDVDKQDANLFARANVKLAKGLSLYADLQYRHVSYRATGVNDNYDATIDGMHLIDVDEHYDFFNPRAGLTYNFGRRHTLYASFAVAQKEPTRADFTDRFRETFPSSERLLDYELGYTFEHPVVSAGVNLYYMDYKDQLVKTGQINDSYDALNINVPHSYRRGIELTASVRPLKWFSFSANATFSQNRIEDYSNKVVDYDQWDNINNTFGYVVTPMGTTPISYSPNVIAGAVFDFHFRGFEALLHTQYVGKQYFTNYENPNMQLDAYCVSNLSLAYTLRTRKVNSVRFGLMVFNVFGAQYCNNGYGYSQTEGGKQADYAFYFAQAPANVLANVTLKF